MWILVAVAFTSAVVQYSLRDGRLVLPPSFDDIGYFADAAVRLCNYYESGALTAFKDYVYDPPHSPYSTLLAVIGFTVFGIRDWAPYAANGVLILAYLAFADYLLRGLRVWQKILATVVLLSVPITAMAVHEFRPDHAAALLTVIAGFLMLERPFITANRRRLWTIGAIFGCTLLTKTSTFPATVVMMIGTMCLASLTDLLIAPATAPTMLGRLRLRKVLRAIGICVGVAALVAAPHYVFAGKQVYVYIYDNFFGYRKEIWKTGGSALFQIMYYIDPDPDNAGGGRMLGRHVFLIAALLLVSAAATLLRPRRKTVLRSAAMFLFLAGTYFAVTVNPQKTVYFGLTFQTAAVFMMLVILRQLLLVQRFRAPRLPWGTAVLLLAVFVGVGEARWPRRFGRYNDAETTARRDIVAGIYNTILQADPSDSGNVDIEGIGDINMPLFQYYNARDQHSYNFYSPYDTDDINVHLAALPVAKYLVLSEPDTRLTADFLLGYRVLPEMNRRIRTMRNWQELAHFVFPPSGRGFYVFQNKPVAFVGWTDDQSVGPLEGPYPQMHLPQIRWGCGPASTLHFVATREPAELHLSFIIRHAKQHMQVFLDGTPLLDHVYSNSDDFQTVHLPLSVTPGTKHTVSITYSEWDKSPDLKRAVIFGELSVVPR